MQGKESQIQYLHSVHTLSRPLSLHTYFGQQDKTRRMTSNHDPPRRDVDTSTRILDATTHGSDHGKPELSSEKYLEEVDMTQENMVYDDAEHEPELHLRTWIALVAMWLYNYTIVFTLLSPPTVVRTS